MASEFDANGVFLRFTSHSPQKELKVPLLSATYYVRVMWWSSLEKMTPLTGAKTASKNAE